MPYYIPVTLNVTRFRQRSSLYDRGILTDIVFCARFVRASKAILCSLRYLESSVKFNLDFENVASRRRPIIVLSGRESSGERAYNTVLSFEYYAPMDDGCPLRTRKRKRSTV